MSTPKLLYGSTKVYTHSVGLSCCFRQWRATSHCRFLHGYALEVQLTFSATQLDDRNWVQDFGGLKEVKAWLEATFDHKLLVAHDDPWLGNIFGLNEDHQCADIITVKDVGCEAFAEMIYHQVRSMTETDRVKLRRVEVREHQGNSAFVEAQDAS